MPDLRRRRIKAAWVDIGLAFIALVVFAILAGDVDLGPDEYTLTLEGWPFVLYLAFVLSYFFLSELSTGQTLGKRWMGLRVRVENSGKPETAAIFLRTLLRLVDWLPLFYLVGYITIRATGERPARVGDLAAGTAVLSVDSASEQPGRISPRAASLGLTLIAAITLVGASVLSTTDEEEKFIGQADRICARLAAEAKPLEAEVASARNAGEAASAMRDVVSFLERSTSELSSLRPPTSMESAWTDYIEGLENRTAVARDAQEAAQRDDRQAFQSAGAELNASRPEVEGALAEFEFRECG